MLRPASPAGYLLPAMYGSARALWSGDLAAREAAVKTGAGCRHFAQQTIRLKTIAMFFGKRFALRNESRGAQVVDHRQRPAGERRKAPAQDGADIAIARISDHVLFVAACRFERLNRQQPTFQFVKIGIRAPGCAAIGKQPRPKALPFSAGVIFIKPFAALDA